MTPVETMWKSLSHSEAFAREDESDDAAFYSKDRLVHHLDAVALSTVERLIETLVIEEAPAILDLMAGWESHLPEAVRPRQVVGLGLNERELARNPALSETVIHDLNKTTELPFPDGGFDVVLNTVSVDYLTRPFEVFREVVRVLEPGGLFLVTFSNRMFPQKAVKIWRECSEPLRIDLVKSYFRATPGFETPSEFVSAGRPRPPDDKYAWAGVPSDPIYAVWAEKKGGSAVPSLRVWAPSRCRRRTRFEKGRKRRKGPFSALIVRFA